MQAFQAHRQLQFDHQRKETACRPILSFSDGLFNEILPENPQAERIFSAPGEQPFDGRRTAFAFSARGQNNMGMLAIS